MGKEVEVEHRGCGGECQAHAESSGDGAVEEEVQEGGGGGTTAAACVVATGVEVWVLQAKEVTDVEEGGVGDLALHEKPCVGLVTKKGVELVVAAMRVLESPVCMEGRVNMVGWGVGGERVCGRSPGVAPGATLGGDCGDSGMEGGQDGGKEAGHAG